jgi:hypothetical protein
MFGFYLRIAIHFFIHLKGCHDMTVMGTSYSGWQVGAKIRRLAGALLQD